MLEMTTLKDETFPFSWFFALFAKVSSAKSFQMRDPRKFIPTKNFINLQSAKVNSREFF